MANLYILYIQFLYKITNLNFLFRFSLKESNEDIEHFPLATHKLMSSLSFWSVLYFYFNFGSSNKKRLWRMFNDKRMVIFKYKRFMKKNLLIYFMFRHMAILASKNNLSQLSRYLCNMSMSVDQRIICLTFVLSASIKHNMIVSIGHWTINK